MWATLLQQHYKSNCSTVASQQNTKERKVRTRNGKYKMIFFMRSNGLIRQEMQRKIFPPLFPLSQKVI